MAETEETPKPAEGSGGGEVAQSQGGTEVNKDARMWAMLCHLLGLFTFFVGPLIIWMLKKEENSFIDNQGKEALNFQITVLIASIVSSLLTVVCIGVFLAIAVGILDIVFCIVACVKANSGEAYRYPVSIRFVK